MWKQDFTIINNINITINIFSRHGEKCDKQVSLCIFYNSLKLLQGFFSEDKTKNSLNVLNML